MRPVPLRHRMLFHSFSFTFKKPREGAAAVLDREALEARQSWPPVGSRTTFESHDAGKVFSHSINEILLGSHRGTSHHQPAPKGAI